MTWKKTDLERLKAASLTDRLSKSAPPARYGSQSNPLSRKEQRERERAQGLVPFAVKLNQDLVKKLRLLAEERNIPLNEVVAEVLEKGLEKGLGK
jgi:hypothetical protein